MNEITRVGVDLAKRVLQVHAVNARRGDEAARVADWDDKVWLTWPVDAGLVLTR